jgi:hypothetical protein
MPYFNTGLVVKFHFSSLSWWFSIATDNIKAAFDRCQDTATDWHGGISDWRVKPKFRVFERCVS